MLVPMGAFFAVSSRPAIHTGARIVAARERFVSILTSTGVSGVSKQRIIDQPIDVVVFVDLAPHWSAPGHRPSIADNKWVANERRPRKRGLAGRPIDIELKLQ